jgi:hypothetical protein
MYSISRILPLSLHSPENSGDVMQLLIGRSRFVLFVAILTVALGACNGDEEANNGVEDTGTQEDATTDTGETEDTATDTSDTMEPECPDLEPCDEDERVVNCLCTSSYDRACDDDSDCRDTETCEPLDGKEYGVCMYEPEPLFTCPGSPGCDEGGGGTLMAGASAKIITPEGFETPMPDGINDDNYLTFNPGQSLDGRWNDCGYDGLCPGDEGYESPDEGEGDGEMQGAWIAGFSSGRPAQTCPDEKIGCDGVDCCVSKWAHDHLEVRATAFKYNDITVAFAVVDTVGWFHTDIAEVKRRVREQVDVDLVIMAATHNHESIDTAGQWGPGDPLPLQSGRDERFLERIYSQSTDAIVESVNGMEEATVEATVLDVGVEGLAISDSRPPYIFNDDVPVVRFVSTDTGDTISTMLSLGQHPEVLWSDNPYLTSDYPHYVRKYIEEGLDAVEDEGGNEVKPALSGLGGTTLFFAGSVGGLINPGKGGAKNYADVSPENRFSFEAADAVGQRLASQVLSAWENGEADDITETEVSFARKEFMVPIENRVFQLAAFQFGLLERDVYNATREGRTDFAPDFPEALSEAAVVRLGPITFFTAPGEVFPETLVGGYPGKPSVRTPVIGDVEEQRVSKQCDDQGLPTEGGMMPCIVKPDQENPPDWDAAPGPPYVYEKVHGEYPFFIGLGMDFLGYMVPRYDYEEIGYLDQPPGSHYEETNGAGREIITIWKSELDVLLENTE